MYLSYLQLNPRHRGARQCLADAHDLHRTIMQAFPQMPEETNVSPRQHFGVLHRVETHPRRDEIGIIVQSRAEPDWSQIEMAFFNAWPRCKPIDRTLDSIEDGQLLAFRLRANPTKRVRREHDDPEGKWKGKRIALTVERDPDTGEVIKDADQVRTEWLQRKAHQGGFELAPTPSAPGVPDVRVIPEDRVFGSGRGKVFWPVLYEGHLHVSDRERFVATLQEGIGPAKAFGFGLLSLAPPRR